LHDGCNAFVSAIEASPAARPVTSQRRHVTGIVELRRLENNAISLRRPLSIMRAGRLRRVPKSLPGTSGLAQGGQNLTGGGAS
jgi:hypothetical protein